MMSREDREKVLKEYLPHIKVTARQVENKFRRSIEIEVGDIVGDVAHTILVSNSFEFLGDLQMKKWIQMIARDRCINVWRAQKAKKRNHTRVSYIEEGEEAQAGWWKRPTGESSTTPADVYERKQFSRLIAEVAKEALTPPQYRMYHLLYEKGLSLQEVAPAFPGSTPRTLHRRMKERLRKALIERGYSFQSLHQLIVPTPISFMRRRSGDPICNYNGGSGASDNFSSSFEQSK